MWVQTLVFSHLFTTSLNLDVPKVSSRVNSLQRFWWCLVFNHIQSCIIIFNWLVVYLPLWKIWKSVGMIIPSIREKRMFQTTTLSHVIRSTVRVETLTVLGQTAAYAHVRKTLSNRSSLDPSGKFSNVLDVRWKPVLEWARSHSSTRANLWSHHGTAAHRVCMKMAREEGRQYWNMHLVPWCRRHSRITLLNQRALERKENAVRSACTVKRPGFHPS